MATEAPGVEQQDREAIDAYEAALEAFAERLNLVHISGGTPSYATVAAASVRPRLTTTGLNEMLTGKRLPTLEALLEYLRVVTTPSGLEGSGPAGGCRGGPVVACGVSWRPPSSTSPWSPRSARIAPSTTAASSATRSAFSACAWTSGSRTYPGSARARPRPPGDGSGSVQWRFAGEPACSAG